MCKIRCKYICFKIEIIFIGDIIESITIDCKHISEEDAAAILRYASPYNVQFGLMPSGVDPSPQASDQLTKCHTERESKLLENYPTLKMDEKLDGDNVKSANEENHIFKKIDVAHVSRVAESSPLARNQSNTANIKEDIPIEVNADASVPPPVNKRTKYLKRDNSNDGIEPTFLDRTNSSNSSGTARDASGIPLELPTHMSESVKWTHHNRRNGSSSAAAPEPQSRTKASLPAQSKVEIAASNGLDHGGYSPSTKLLLNNNSIGKLYPLRMV